MNESTQTGSATTAGAKPARRRFLRCPHRRAPRPARQAAQLNPIDALRHE